MQGGVRPNGKDRKIYTTNEGSLGAVIGFNPIRSLGLIVFCFLGEQMLLVVLGNNSGLF